MNSDNALGLLGIVIIVLSLLVIGPFPSKNRTTIKAIMAGILIVFLCVCGSLTFGLFLGG